MRYREWWAGLQCRGHIGRLHLLERTCNETLRSEAVTRLEMINDEQRMNDPCLNAMMQICFLPAVSSKIHRASTPRY